MKKNKTKQKYTSCDSIQMQTQNNTLRYVATHHYEKQYIVCTCDYYNQQGMRKVSDKGRDVCPLFPQSFRPKSSKGGSKSSSEVIVSLSSRPE